jgi:hypothetical protein
VQLVETVIKYGLWQLLPLLCIPVAFGLIQKIGDLTFRDTIQHFVFHMTAGILVVSVGVLFKWYPPPQSFLTAPSFVFVPVGLVLAGVGVYGLLTSLSEIPALPNDQLVITIAAFNPVSANASDDAANLCHRVEQSLLEKASGGLPLQIKRSPTAIDGADEQERRAAATRLGLSRRFRSHYVLWGDVRRDDGQLFFRPRLTVAKELPGTSVGEPTFEPVVLEDTSIQFKEQLASDIADTLMLVYGLSFYRTRQWDRCLEILEYVETREARLLCALSLSQKASKR